MALQQDEKNKKTAVLAFGRMNPPTTGHEKLINKTHEVAKQHGGTAHVVASHSHDNDKNPLPQDKKLGYLRKVAHPDVKVSGSSKEHPTIMHHASKLHAAGHTHLVVVAGGGREKEFHNTLHKYNGKTGAHGHYNFKKISVVSSGKRDPDSHGTEGISGTKMRNYARSGQHDKFKQGLPKALHPHAKEIHTHVGGTQLESFKEAVAMKKKFKPSGEKTKVTIHAIPAPDRSDKAYGLKSSGGKGAPANTTRSGGTRFGEHRYMRMVNAEFEEFVGGEQLDEVLSRQGRIKRALMLRRYKHKIQRRKKMMRKKLATKPMLQRRARRHAVKLVRKRFMGKKGEQYHKLGMADKILIDKKVATKKAIIDRIAQRLLPKVRRAELVRLRDMKKGSKPSAAFKSAGASKPTTVKKGATWSKTPKPLTTYSTPGAKTQTATRSYTMPQQVKSEGYVTEDNVVEIVDMLSMLTEKDMKALDKKIANSDIDSNILFEVFVMGLESEGDQTPQQKGFMSLNTFMAEDYNTPAATEVPDKEHSYQAAITDLALNTRNRNSTIKNYNYGPLNEDDDEYWEKVADLWDTDTKTVKESRCHNCAAFDRKPDTLKKIAEVMGPDGKKIVEMAHLGYCELFAFKCAGQRVCDAWIGGGPIKEEKHLYEAMANWNDDPITGVQLDRRYNRPMVTKSTMPKLKEFKADYEDSFVADPVDPKKIDWKDSHITAAYKMGQRAKKGSKNPFHKKNDPEGQLHACWNMGMRGESMPKEALEYPHETAKKYKKDTPGQQVKDSSKKVNEMFEDLLSDKQVKKAQDKAVSQAVSYVRKRDAEQKKRIAKVTKKVLAPTQKTKVGGTQNEDAEAMARAMDNQRGERDRIRQAYEREMERLDNSEEKKRLKQNHERRLQGLKARQKAARERLRARP